MRPVAKWGFFAVLAPAPGHFLFIFDFHLHGGNIGSSVGPIAKWLSLRSATSAPMVGAWFHVQDVRGSLRNDNWVAHVILLQILQEIGGDDYG